MQFYTAPKLELSEDEVFVFGANLQGFHGAGAAGYATFHEFGNLWRKYNYNNSFPGGSGADKRGNAEASESIQCSSAKRGKGAERQMTKEQMKFPKIATRLEVIAQENGRSIEEAKKIAASAVKAGEVVKEIATRLEGGGVYYRLR